MRALRASAYAFVVATSLAGCQQSTSDVEYAGEVRVSSPELIEIGPNVSVLADADEPLFYSQGYYWLHRDGAWFRSDSYRGGFQRVDLAYVPTPVRAIERPELYVQYRRNAGRDPMARRGQTPVRSGPQQPPANQGVPSTPPPDTWQPGQQPHGPMHPHGGSPQPPHQPGGMTPPGTSAPTGTGTTPPVTAPEDTQGTPMPPHHEPIDDRDPDSPNRPQGSSATGTPTTPDRDDQATPPSPPGDRRTTPPEQQTRDLEEEDAERRNETF